MFKEKDGWGFEEKVEEEEEEEEEEEYSYSYSEEEGEDEEDQEEAAIAHLAVNEAAVRAIGAFVAEGNGEEDAEEGEMANRFLVNIRCLYCLSFAL